MIYFMASTGIWRSAEARGSWRSLVATLARGFGYVFGWIIVVAMAAGIAIGCLTLPFIGMIVDAMGLGNFLGKYWSALVTLVCLVLAWRLHGAANLRLWYAQTWIDEHERYGRTFTRSLSRALRKHQEKVEASRREAQEARDAVATASSPPA